MERNLTELDKYVILMSVVLLSFIIFIVALYRTDDRNDIYRIGEASSVQYEYKGNDTRVAELIKYYESLGWEFKECYLPVTSVYGITCNSDKCVIIWRDAGEHTIYHELGHVIYYTEKISNSEKMSLLALADELAWADYQLDSPNELYAQAFMLHMFYNDDTYVDARWIY